MPKKVRLPMWYVIGMSIILILCVVVMLSVAKANRDISSDYNKFYKEYTQIKSEKEVLEGKVVKLENELSDKKVNLEQSITDKDLYEKTLLERDSEIKRLNEVILTTDNKVKTLEEQLQNLLKTFEEYKKELGE